MDKVRTLAGNMSVIFNLDGQQLHRFLDTNISSVHSFIESLILHDEVIIPTQDYLSVSALIHLLGEKNIIELLENGYLKFARMKGLLGYYSPSGIDGIITVFGSLGKKNIDRPKTLAINSAFDVLSKSLENRQLLLDLILQATIEMEMAEILAETRPEIYSDFENTSLWLESNLDSETHSRFPKLSPGTIKTLGASSKPNENLIDALLSIALANIELRLAQKLNCIDSSTVSPIGRLLKIKSQRLSPSLESSQAFTHLREITKVPNIGESVLKDNLILPNLLKLRNSRNCLEFRQWFHTNCHSDEKSITSEYIKLLEDVPFIQSKPSRIIRFITTTGLGFIPVVGQFVGTAAGAIDSFFLEDLLQGKSPKFFINDLRQFDGLSKGFGVKKTTKRKK
jgi:hypothetical protein